MKEFKRLPSFDDFVKENLTEKEMTKIKTQGNKYKFIVIKTLDGALATMKAKFIEHDPNQIELMGIWREQMQSARTFDEFKKAFDDSANFFLAYDQLKKDVPEAAGFTGRFVNVFIISLMDKTKYNDFPKEYYYEKPNEWHVWLVPIAELPKYAKPGADNRIVSEVDKEKQKTLAQLNNAISKKTGAQDNTASGAAGAVGSDVTFTTPKGTPVIYSAV